VDWVRRALLEPKSAMEGMEALTELAVWTVVAATELSPSSDGSLVTVGTVLSTVGGYVYEDTPADALLFDDGTGHPAAFQIEAAQLACACSVTKALSSDHALSFTWLEDGARTLSMTSQRQGTASGRTAKGAWFFEGDPVFVDLFESSLETTPDGASGLSYISQTSRGGSLAQGPVSTEVHERHLYTLGTGSAGTLEDTFQSLVGLDSGVMSLNGAVLRRTWSNGVETSLLGTGSALQAGAPVASLSTSSEVMVGVNTLINVLVTDGIDSASIASEWVVSP
jgi:hypothetical protein